MMKRLAVLLALAGCAAQQGQSLPPLDQNIQNLLANLKQVSIADLQNAETIAVAHNDQLMIPCYPALIQFVNSFAGPNGTVNGAFSAFETVRVTRMGLMGGLPAYLKLGCAAGVIDEAQFVANLTNMLGVAGALAPLAPVVAPVIGPVLLKPPPDKPAPVENKPVTPPINPPPALDKPAKKIGHIEPQPKADRPTDPYAAVAILEMATTERLLAAWEQKKRPVVGGPAD